MINTSATMIKSSSLNMLVNQSFLVDTGETKMELSERIAEAREAAGLSQAKLATKCGVSRASVSAWEAGRVKDLKNEHLFCVARITGYSAKWLATGSGDRRADNHEIEWNGPMDAWDSSTPLNPDEVELPLFREVEIAAGGGRTEVIENHGAKLRFARSTLARAGIQPENAACATVKGNSMDRLIPDGTTIGVDTGSREVKDGEIYAIDHNGMLRVKYLYRRPGGGLKIVSENSEEHPDEFLSPEEVEEDVRIIGRVFWWSVLR